MYVLTCNRPTYTANVEMVFKPGTLRPMANLSDRLGRKLSPSKEEEEGERGCQREDHEANIGDGLFLKRSFLTQTSGLRVSMEFSTVTDGNPSYQRRRIDAGT
ncbi:hypothetical protein AVEN_245242-1 [Araneus ventricosus]|uniref:Uncharacterized protein n=1 Tax=Araneus ventricosus TaxID=182803 RepID=A0A4Y2PPT1_ARAVE|nr:hypothetical protein AVEN_245242-1 [Araneus ventricosus]